MNILIVFSEANTKQIVYIVMIESIIRSGIEISSVKYKNSLNVRKVTQNYVFKILFHISRLYPTEGLYSDVVKINKRRL